MKNLLRLIVPLVLAAHQAPAGVSDKKEGRYIEYWERSSYREGFHDGYDDGINRNCYEFELDSIAYEIGFIDGEEAFEENRNPGSRFNVRQSSINRSFDHLAASQASVESPEPSSIHE